jgi:hypothetical protein
MGMGDASAAVCIAATFAARSIAVSFSLALPLSLARWLAVESICTTLTAPVLKPWPVSSGRARLDGPTCTAAAPSYTLPTSMPSSSSSGTPARIPPLAHHAHASSDRTTSPSPSPASIPPAEPTSPARRFHPLHPRAATRSPSHAHALPTHPDVAASVLPATLLLLPPSPPPTPQSPPARTPSKASSIRREHRPRTALPTIDKVDSRPKTIAANVKSRAHSRLASFGRIRSRGALQPTVTEPLPLSELPPLRPTPSLTSSHKRSEPSTGSYYSSETTLSDEKFHDSKSFDEPRKSLARDTQRNASFERRGKSEDSTCDPTEQYRRLVESRPRMMHQTSSRLLRMTEDDRPFTRVSTTSPCACAPITTGAAVPFVAHE